MATVTVTYTNEQLQEIISALGIAIDVATLDAAARDNLVSSVVQTKITSTLEYPRGRRLRSAIRASIASIGFGGPEGLFVTFLEGIEFVTAPYLDTVVFGADVRSLTLMMDAIPGYEGAGWDLLMQRASTDTSPRINLGGGIEAQMLFIYNSGELKSPDITWANGALTIGMFGLVHPGIDPNEVVAYANANYKKVKITRGSTTVAEFPLAWPWEINTADGFVSTMVMNTEDTFPWMLEIAENPSDYTFSMVQ